MDRLTKNNYQDDLLKFQVNYNDDLWNKVKNVEDIEEIILAMYKKPIYYIIGTKICTKYYDEKRNQILYDFKHKEIVVTAIGHVATLVEDTYKIEDCGVTWSLEKKELDKSIYLKDYGKIWPLEKKELE